MHPKFDNDVSFFKDRGIEQLIGLQIEQLIGLTTRLTAPPPIINLAAAVTAAPPITAPAATVTAPPPLINPAATGPRYPRSSPPPPPPYSSCRSTPCSLLMGGAPGGRVSRILVTHTSS